MADKVELHQAFMFDCPDCGVENFHRAVRLSREQIVADLDDEELAMLDGLVDLSGGCNVLMGPDRVSCKHCGAEFETEDELG